MARFRVTAVSESKFVLDVEAETPADAATQLGDKIRAGEIEPIVGPAIASVDVQRQRDSRK